MFTIGELKVGPILPLTAEGERGIWRVGDWIKKIRPFFCKSYSSDPGSEPFRLWEIVS